MLLKSYENGVHRPVWGLLVLVRREDGRAVGGIGFHGVPDEKGRVEIGYDLAEAALGQRLRDRGPARPVRRGRWGGRR
ncbi:hypothetical protein STENM327S_08419 [Streptomyces tendae]